MDTGPTMRRFYEPKIYMLLKVYNLSICEERTQHEKYTRGVQPTVFLELLFAPRVQTTGENIYERSQNVISSPGANPHLVQNQHVVFLYLQHTMRNACFIRIHKQLVSYKITVKVITPLRKSVMSYHNKRSCKHKSLQSRHLQIVCAMLNMNVKTCTVSGLLHEKCGRKCSFFAFSRGRQNIPKS